MKYDEIAGWLDNGKSLYRDGWETKGWISVVSDHVVAGVTLPTAKESKVVFYAESPPDGSYVPYEMTPEDAKATDWHVYNMPDPVVPEPPKVEKPKPAPVKKVAKRVWEDDGGK